MDKKSLAIGGAALLAGAALGWYLKPAAAAPTAAAEPTHAVQARKLPDAGADSSLRALRSRIRDLERQLALQRAEALQPETSTQEVARAEETDRRGPRPWGPPEDFKKHMAEMEKNDPVRFAQMTNHMAQARQRRLRRSQDRMDILASVDTSRMTRAQKKVHDDYQELLARREELLAMIQPGNDDVEPAERKKAFEEMSEINSEIRELAQSERDTLLSQTATDLGVASDAVPEMVDTVKAIFEATNSGGHGPGGPGGPGVGAPPAGAPPPL